MWLGAIGRRAGGVRMGWRSLAGGLVAGTLIGGVAVAALLLQRATDTDVVFPKKSFYSAAEVPPVIPGQSPIRAETVDVSGSEHGPHLAYENNIFSAHCDKGAQKCWIASVAQIGSKHLGDIVLDDWPVTEWSQDYVVAKSSDPESTPDCRVSTMHINLHSRETFIDVSPVESNMTDEKACPAKTSLHEAVRWSLDDSPYWRAEAKRTGG